MVALGKSAEVHRALQRMLEVIADLLDDICEYLSSSRPGMFVQCCIFSAGSSGNEAAFLKNYKDKVRDCKDELTRAKEAFDRIIAFNNYELLLSTGTLQVATLTVRYSFAY